MVSVDNGFQFNLLLYFQHHIVNNQCLKNLFELNYFMGSLFLQGALHYLLLNYYLLSFTFILLLWITTIWTNYCFGLSGASGNMKSPRWFSNDAVGVGSGRRKVNLRHARVQNKTKQLTQTFYYYILPYLTLFY